MAAIDSGYTCVFHQDAAPVGWTKATSINDAGIVLSSSAGPLTLYNPGYPFTGTFASSQVPASPTLVSTPAISLGPTTLTIAQMAAHSHGPQQMDSPSAPSVLIAGVRTPGRPLAAPASLVPVNPATVSGGIGGSAHSHSLTFDKQNFSHTLNLTAKYVSLILATRD